MQIRWRPSFSASCLHAAASIAAGLPIADTATAANGQPAVDALCGELQACGLPVDSTLELLIGLAADYEGNRQLIEVASKQLQSPEKFSDTTTNRLAGCITDLEAAVRRHQPNIVEELAVRGRPLREQWEARGPGLLHAVKKLTEENFLVESAEVILALPIVGGHGRAHLRSNRVTLEGVLTHPDPELPETLRLGWLLSQLNLDLPMHSETVPSTRLPTLASLATLPLVLAAAEQVELARCDEITLKRALQSWHLPTNLPNEVVAKLLDWWTAYIEGQTRWSVAMAALEQMLFH